MGDPRIYVGEQSSKESILAWVNDHEQSDGSAACDWVSSSDPKDGESIIGWADKDPGAQPGSFKGETLPAMIFIAAFVVILAIILVLAAAVRFDFGKAAVTAGRSISYAAAFDHSAVSYDDYMEEADRYGWWQTYLSRDSYTVYKYSGEATFAEYMDATHERFEDYLSFEQSLTADSMYAGQYNNIYECSQATLSAFGGSRISFTTLMSTLYLYKDSNLSSSGISIQFFLLYLQEYGKDIINPQGTA